MTSSPSTTTSTKVWNWRGFPICYSSLGNSGKCVILVHGFGASGRHWRKNMPALAENYRVYTIDLIGFGGSAKPQPGEKIVYTLETWGEQIADFCREIVGEPAVLVGNSIGSIAIMQAAVNHPDIALGTALINCSLRLLHDRKRSSLPWIKRFGSPILQRLLAIEPVGKYFFSQVAQPKTVRRLLLQAYANSATVTDELVDIIVTPAKDEGAAGVFVAFTAYSTGPLPEDLLPLLSCPAIILWGTKDPWEPIDLGRELAKFPTVQKFVPLEGVGHCPQDEAPELVNPIILDWIGQL